MLESTADTHFFRIFSMDTLAQLGGEHRLEEGCGYRHPTYLSNSAEPLAEPGANSDGRLCSA